MSTDDRRTKWRRNSVENFNRLSRVHECYRHTTDRQTTDGRTMTYSERERELVGMPRWLHAYQLSYAFMGIAYNWLFETKHSGGFPPDQNEDLL